ncbi:hypothetical protein O3I_016145 [Nocardia brasiliensis ATCC 700358]|uniref:Uncharacterized protein n=1 Tax=Nocardia brasiliensis (strain ATCC 700358 / HUJEG-1) TaxID=1133849 RepID=K0EWD4_NOCB7|nr:hypothetical protein O3I_016145 [Nocardia brasiliensis ATCC 700358]
MAAGSTAGLDDRPAASAIGTSLPQVGTYGSGVAPPGGAAPADLGVAADAAPGTEGSGVRPPGGALLETPCAVSDVETDATSPPAGGLDGTSTPDTPGT